MSRIVVTLLGLLSLLALSTSAPAPERTVDNDVLSLTETSYPKDTEGMFKRLQGVIPTDVKQKDVAVVKSQDVSKDVGNIEVPVKDSAPADVDAVVQHQDGTKVSVKGDDDAAVLDDDITDADDGDDDDMESEGKAETAHRGWRRPHHHHHHHHRRYPYGYGK